MYNKQIIAIIDEDGDIDEIFPINTTYDEIFRIREIRYKKSKVFVVNITIDRELKD